MFSRKSAINKAKKLASIKSEMLNKQKQIMRNIEFYNLKTHNNEEANMEAERECHSIKNFTKEMNMMVPTLKLVSSLPKTKSKLNLEEIKRRALLRQISTINLNKDPNFNPNALKDRRFSLRPNLPAERNESLTEKSSLSMEIIKEDIIDSQKDDTANTK